MLARRLFGKNVIFALSLQIAVLVAVSGIQAREVVYQGKTYDIASPGEAIPGEIVLQLKPGATARQAEATAKAIGGRITGNIDEYGLYRVALSARPAAAGTLGAESAAIAAAKADPAVMAAFRNVKFSIPTPVGIPGSDVTRADGDGSSAAEVLPNLAPTGNQWHLKAINWSLAGTPPATAPVVAVIDTGVQYDHPDLRGNVLLGQDFVDDDLDPNDTNGHGTHCAGTIAATGAFMARGVAPSSKILAVRVLDGYGAGSLFNVMAGVVYARGYAGVKILNLSLSGYLIQGSAEYNSFKQVIDDTRAMGVLPVVAAGNENNYDLYASQGLDNYRPVPAWYPTSLTVGATQENNMRAYFSNYNVGILDGKTFNYTFVDLVAPGWNILSTSLDHQYTRLNGTSMAAAVVSGCAAFYWGTNTASTTDQVITALKTTGMAVNVYNGFPTAGKRVDLMKAMGVNATGFVGVVYNGRTGIPLKYAAVSVKQSGTVVATTTTDPEGFFVVSGLTGGTAYILSFAKTGFATYGVAGTTVADTMTHLVKPVFLNQNRPSGQWSVIVDWRSWHPGLDEADATYPTKPSWYPYNWDTVAGTFMTSYVSSTSLGTIDLKTRGSLTEPPYMAVTTDANQTSHPANAMVIKPQTGQTYKVYARLDNNNPDFFEWGKFKSLTNVTQPFVNARFYLAGAFQSNVNAASATGTGTFWYIGDISGTTFTVRNLLQATAP